MKTDDLIRKLAAKTPPQPPRRSWLLWAALAGLTFAAAVFLAVAGLRPDIGAAWAASALKAGFGALAALALVPLVMRAAAPSVRLRDASVAILGVVILAAIVTAIGLYSTPAALRWTLWTGGGVPDCLRQIPLIALPIAAALFLAARKFGPTRLGAAGFALGAMAGALAAIPYALFCPVDFAPYVATWYAASIGLCALIGSLAGTRLLRW